MALAGCGSEHTEHVGTSAPAAPADVSWIHVEHPSDGTLPYFADAAGREVILRGVNSEGLEDEAWRSDAANPRMYYPTDPTAYAGRCPANSNEVAAPLCEVDAGKGRYAQPYADQSQNDFAQMRHFGFNLVRLALSWSQLEPTPGDYHTNYLEQVAQVVAWAHEQGVYVILDMHEDQYSRWIQTDPTQPLPQGASASGGFDGAPAWAALTDGKPSYATFGLSVFNPAVNAAFNHFWKNSPVPVAQGDAPGMGLQDHWIGAIAALARRCRDEPAVLGYEIMNEPQLGTFKAYDLAGSYMYPFYRRVIEAITGARDDLPDCPAAMPSGTVPGGSCAYPDLGVHDTRHIVLFEPAAVRNLVDYSPQQSAPFTQYPNIAYAPHTYTHVFTLDSSFIGYTNQSAPYPPSYDFAYATAAAEATAIGAAMLVTEFGNGPGEDLAIMAGTVRAQERWKASNALWTWKANCSLDPSDTCMGGWSFYDGPPGGPGDAPLPQNAAPKPVRRKLLQRIVPRATAGRLDGYAYDVDTQAFFMEASGAAAVVRGDQSSETVIFVPDVVPGALDVQVSGEAMLDATLTNPDGTRLIFVAPTGGRYGVSIGAGADVAALRQRVATEPAADPVDAAHAQQALLGFIQTAKASADRNIASRATLASGIIASLLGNSGGG